jgi:hypothetical protein
MKSPEYISHGTSSKEDAEGIQEKGFEAQEGRATVSGDLIYAFDWATTQERRRGSKSESSVGEEERGRILIMKVPRDKSIDYATHTDIKVDDELKEVTGYSSKYESGRKQLAIFQEGDIVEKREEIERAKEELKDLNKELSNYLKEYNINLDNFKSRGDLAEVLQAFDIDKKIEILKTIEGFEKRLSDKRKEAEPDIQIAQENILMSVVPTVELGEKLAEFKQKIKNLKKVDLENFTAAIAKIIEDNSENFLASGLDVREVVTSLLVTTMEAEVVNMVRSLAIDVKRVQGFKIYNRGK